MVEMVVWTPERGPKTQPPVVTLVCLSPCPVIESCMAGQLLWASSFTAVWWAVVSSRAQPGMEVPGEAWGLQSPMEHSGFAEERLCYVGTTSLLSPSYPHHWHSSLHLCSLQLRASGNKSVAQV